MFGGEMNGSNGDIENDGRESNPQTPEDNMKLSNKN
jgi:hypothetical protein